MNGDNKLIKFEVYKENTFKCYKGQQYDSFTLHYSNNEFIIEKNKNNVKGEETDIEKNMTLIINYEMSSKRTIAIIELTSGYYDNIYFNRIQPKDIAVFGGE